VIEVIEEIEDSLEEKMIDLPDVKIEKEVKEDKVETVGKEETDRIETLDLTIEIKESKREENNLDQIEEITIETMIDVKIGKSMNVNTNLAITILKSVKTIEEIESLSTGLRLPIFYPEMITSTSTSRSFH